VDDDDDDDVSGGGAGRLVAGAVELEGVLEGLVLGGGVAPTARISMLPSSKI